MDITRDRHRCSCHTLQYCNFCVVICFYCHDFYELTPYVVYGSYFLSTFNLLPSSKQGDSHQQRAYAGMAFPRLLTREAADSLLSGSLSPSLHFTLSVFIHGLSVGVC